MIQRFGRNLLSLLFWTAVVVFTIGAVVMLLVFGFSLFQHFTATQSDPGFGYALEEQQPAILWWAGAAGLTSAVVAVATYSISPDEGEYYYCPNCECQLCVEERRQRALADVTTAAMAGGLAGGIVGGNSS